MIHQIELSLAAALCVVGLVGLGGRLDLFRRPCQCDHLGMHVGGVLGHDLGRVALGVDGNEHRTHIDALLIQDIDRKRVARDVERTHVGTEGIPEIDQRGPVDDIRLGDDATVGRHQLERATDRIEAARNCISSAAVRCAQQRVQRRSANDSGQRQRRGARV